MHPVLVEPVQNAGILVHCSGGYKEVPRHLSSADTNLGGSEAFKKALEFSEVIAPYTV